MRALLADPAVPAIFETAFEHALRAYCARDTLALLRVHQALREMTR